MKIHHTSSGIDINRIECTSQEIPKALKALDDNLSQVTRVTLVIDGEFMYIYHDTCSGYKRASSVRLDPMTVPFITQTVAISGHKNLSVYV